MEKLSNLAKVTQPERSRARIPLQAVWLQGPCSAKSVDFLASSSWLLFFFFSLGWGLRALESQPVQTDEERKPEALLTTLPA